MACCMSVTKDNLNSQNKKGDRRSLNGNQETIFCRTVESWVKSSTRTPLDVEYVNLKNLLADDKNNQPMQCPSSAKQEDTTTRNKKNRRSLQDDKETVFIIKAGTSTRVLLESETRNSKWTDNENTLPMKCTSKLNRNGQLKYDKDILIRDETTKRVLENEDENVRNLLADDGYIQPIDYVYYQNLGDWTDQEQNSRCNQQDYEGPMLMPAKTVTSVSLESEEVQIKSVSKYLGTLTRDNTTTCKNNNTYSLQDNKDIAFILEL